MNLKFLALAALLPLVAACNGTMPTITLPNLGPAIGNAQACAAALIENGSTDPAVLAIAAATTPACINLGQDVVNTILVNVQKQNVIAQRHRMMMMHEHAGY
jgi:hypothetical protein